MENRSLVTIAEHSREKILYMLEMAKEFEAHPNRHILDGKVLGTYSYSKENRVFVGYNDLSPNIINALIATEDVRFAEHSGIDAYALTRAVVKRGILMQKNAGGGSTITQQLSKQLYSPSADNVMERLFLSLIHISEPTRRS